MSARSASSSISRCSRRRCRAQAGRRAGRRPRSNGRRRSTSARRCSSRKATSPISTSGLALYRRIATRLERREIDAFAAELIDRFGPLPAEVHHLLEIVAIKALCREAEVEKIEAGPKGAVSPSATTIRQSGGARRFHQPTGRHGEASPRPEARPHPRLGRHRHPPFRRQPAAAGAGEDRRRGKRAGGHAGADQRSRQARRNAPVGLIDRLNRRVQGKIEQREKELGLLGAGDGVAAVDDEAGDTRDAEAPSAAVVGQDLLERGVAGRSWVISARSSPASAPISARVAGLPMSRPCSK